MISSKRALWLSVLTVSTALAAPAFAASDPLGVWIDDTGRGGVEITQCGDNLCGKLVWLKDGKNAKACGTEILGNVKPAGAGTWDGGWVYSPERKSKFDVELKLLGDDRLQVIGYLGTKLFSKTMIWTRAGGTITRCDAAEGTVAAAKPVPEEQVPPAATPSRSSDKEPVQASKPEVAKKGDTSRANEKIAAAGEEREDEDSPVKFSGGSGKDCTLKVPYVTITFPCPEK